MPSALPERPITVYGTIAANAVIAVSKFAAAIISGSSAMLSEAIHSVVGSLPPIPVRRWDEDLREK